MGVDPLARARRIFQTAIELSRRQRERLLALECGADEELRPAFPQPGVRAADASTAERRKE